MERGHKKLSHYEQQREEVTALVDGEYNHAAFSTAILALQSSGSQKKSRVKPEALFTTLSQLANKSKERAVEAGDEPFSTTFDLLKRNYDLTLAILSGQVEKPAAPPRATMTKRKG